jgi:KUP system potassium uptake protein
MMLICLACLELGLIQIAKHPEVFKAQPYYAYNLLSVHPDGFFVLGFVFLCTTGAEALYSDMGHCWKKNIRISWICENYIGSKLFWTSGILIHHEGRKH